MKVGAELLIGCLTLLAASAAAQSPGPAEVIDRVARKGAEGPVAFLHPRSCHGVLVELIEAPGGPAWAALGYEGSDPVDAG